MKTMAMNSKKFDITIQSEKSEHEQTRQKIKEKDEDLLSLKMEIGRYN